MLFGLDRLKRIKGTLLITAVLAALSVLVACERAGTSTPSPSLVGEAPPTVGATATPTPDVARPFDVAVEVVAKELTVPWAVDFAPDGRIFITEREGAIRVIQDGVLRLQPYAEVEMGVRGEGGLLGLAVDPDFASNGFLYVFHTYRNERGLLRNRVLRLVDRGDTAEVSGVILEDIPAERIHNGGRIKFGLDGKLYVTTGDVGAGPLAQNLNSLAGKILRINPDGSIPQDNPFPGSPVYSYGHRNPQGLAWHPVTGQLFATEHGPVGHDEVNIIQPGANYGWPTVSGVAGTPRFQDPLLESGVETWAPGGAVIYSGEELPEEWQGRLVFGALRGQQLVWVQMRPPEYQGVAASGKLYGRRFGRLREVVQGPDGYIYFTTSNVDGRGNPSDEDDLLLRIVPVTGSLSGLPTGR